jgi:eukaryotic-like serine/threonine-protein kinase
MFLSPGDYIGPFQIRDIIGIGSTGVVYRALNPITHEERALKLLSEEVLEYAHDDLVARYRQEAQVAGALRHPGLLYIYGFGEHQGVPYLIMEYRRAATLAKRLKQGPMPLAESLSLLSQLAQALQVVHAKGIVHRDVKPTNILYDDRGQATVIDFGIARLRGSSLTRAGAIMGALGYCAPEQIQMSHAVDHRADLFALGVLFYVTLTGQKPFVTNSMDEFIEAVLRHQPKPLKAINPKLSGKVQALSDWLLTKDVDTRCPDTSALLTRLEELRAELSPFDS